jgi:berberine-like enzyme
LASGAGSHQHWARDHRLRRGAIAGCAIFTHEFRGAASASRRVRISEPVAAADVRANESYGNAERLLATKRTYDPDNVFRPAIPLPVPSANGASARGGGNCSARQNPTAVP